MDKNAAATIALDLAQRHSTVRLAIRDELTIDKDFGWVFFYWSALPDADGARALVGNAPVLVDRRSGKARFTGTSFPTEWYVRAYEALGEQRFDTGEWREFIVREYAREFDE